MFSIEILNDVLADYLAVTLSFFALIIAIQTYRQDKRKANQDLLFEEKMKAYQEIIFQARTITTSLFDLVDEVQFSELTKEEWEAKFQTISGQYYAMTFDYRNLLFRYITIIPNNVFSSLHDFSSRLTMFVTSSAHCNTEITVNSYDRIEHHSNQIIDIIRKDLHVDKLDRGLSSRIK
jgi:hypothetical protein